MLQMYYKNGVTTGNYWHKQANITEFVKLLRKGLDRFFWHPKTWSICIAMYCLKWSIKNFSFLSCMVFLTRYDNFIMLKQIFVWYLIYFNRMFWKILRKRNMSIYGKSDCKHIVWQHTQQNNNDQRYYKMIKVYRFNTLKWYKISMYNLMQKMV